MPPQPKRRQACPACKQPMKWFNDHWVCVNVKAHALALGAGSGGASKYRKRKRRR